MDGVEVGIVTDLGDSYGVLLIATFLATALWGITCLQTYVHSVTLTS